MLSLARFAADRGLRWRASWHHVARCFGGVASSSRSDENQLASEDGPMDCALDVVSAQMSKLSIWKDSESNAAEVWYWQMQEFAQLLKSCIFLVSMETKSTHFVKVVLFPIWAVLFLFPWWQIFLKSCPASNFNETIALLKSYHPPLFGWTWSLFKRLLCPRFPGVKRVFWKMSVFSCSHRGQAFSKYFPHSPHS